MNFRNRITFIKLPRSGSHAVIHWLMCLCEPPSAFVPFYGALPPSTNSHHKVWIYDRSLDEYPVNEKKTYLYLDTLAWSHENVSIDEIYRREFGLQAPNKNFFIVIIREFYNWCASVFINGGSSQPPWPRTFQIDLWKDQAIHYLEKGSREQLVCILFDRWFTSKSYRKSIAEQLGLKFSDEGLNKIVDPLGASSWDGLKYKDAAQKMDVLNRYRKTWHFTTYRNIVSSDPEALMLNEEILDGLQ